MIGRLLRYFGRMTRQTSSWNSLGRFTARHVSRAFHAFRRGGVRYLPDDEVFRRVLEDLGRTPTLSLAGYLEELADAKTLRETHERERRARGQSEFFDWRRFLLEHNGNIILFLCHHARD